jgi:hypothetical protein
LVIGDSLTVGMGSVEVFDPLKNKTIQQNTATGISSRTFSSQFQQPIHWRNGGVDGGEVNDVRKYCMDIVRQECSAVDKASIWVHIILKVHQILYVCCLAWMI